MSTFIKQFEKDYIYELQNIPYYNRDAVDGVTKREMLSWFDEHELEIVFESAKTVVANFLEEKNCKWVIESSEFADDVETAICLCMIYGCLSRVIDEGYRDKKIKADPRFKGFIDDSTAKTLSQRKEEYDDAISEKLDSIVSRANKSTERTVENLVL